jgi:triphosphoribosyl-dephospho-CoA synthase
VKQLPLSAGSIATLACCLEVAAPKAGNVHRGADFENLVLEDFLVSATVLGQTIDECLSRSVGETVLTIIERTSILVGTNTNLGMALLLVPLAKAIQWNQLESRKLLTARHTKEVLQKLGAEEGELIYRAIRQAHAGGLGKMERADLSDPFPADMTVIDVMSLAADRDLVARQYTNNFQNIFGSAIDYLLEGKGLFPQLNQAIVFAHLAMMAEFSDSLILRKCGAEDAALAQSVAKKCIQNLRRTNKVQPETDWSEVSEFDFWLRAKGNQRNPGTTADLIASALFVAVHNRLILPPYR